MLIEYGKTNQVELKAFYSRIEKLKSELMKDTELFLLIVRAGKYHEDKKKLKLDRKEARKLMKNMSMKKQKITTEDMKRAQLTFSFEPGEGSVGMLFKLLFIKLMQFLKSPFLLILNLSLKKRRVRSLQALSTMMVKIKKTFIDE
jgi:hypothetical protein